MNVFGYPEFYESEIQATTTRGIWQYNRHRFLCNSWIEYKLNIRYSDENENETENATLNLLFSFFGFLMNTENWIENYQPNIDCVPVFKWIENNIEYCWKRIMNAEIPFYSCFAFSFRMMGCFPFVYPLWWNAHLRTFCSSSSRYK